MNILGNIIYRKLFLLGLAIILFASWFSVGFNQLDEHFQILEFCSYKLGITPASDLPWEFADHCRTAVLPFIAFCVCKGLGAFGMFDPFRAAFVLRFFSGIFAWWVICRLVLKLLPDFATEKGKKLFAICSFFIWYVPYIGVRFSSENTSAILFFLAMSIIVDIIKPSEKVNYTKIFVIGFLLGLSFFIRIQMVFALLGLGIWLIIFRRMKWQFWLGVVTSACIAIALCVLIDYWFYGIWMFTPYNYFNTNIIHHVAANFGVSPWYYYINFFIQLGIPPLSVGLLLLFFVGLWKNPKNIFSFIIIAFLLGHTLIGHKEMRFIFPMCFAFIYILCLGVDFILQKYPIKPYMKWLFNLLVFVDIAFLIFKISIPCQEAVKYYEYIYNYSKSNNTKLIYFTESPFSLSKLEVDFYKYKNFTQQHINNATELTELLKGTDKNTTILYLSHKIKPDEIPENCSYEKLYCYFPDFLLKFNFNDWQDRSNIWTLYRLRNK